MTAQTLQLGLIQHACAPGEDALPKACGMIRDAAGRGARLVVTQELFRSHYFPQTEDETHFTLAEPIPGPTTRALGELARELGIAISASLFERRAAGVYHNTAVMIGPDGEIAGTYRKMHVPEDPRFYEKFYFTPGDLGFSVQRTCGVDVGTLICWDQWFPEAARLTALRGAELLLYPTAIGYVAGEPAPEQRQQREAWRTVQRAHAITNGVFVAAANRVGVEDGLTFWGSSFVCDPFGEVLAEAPEDREEVLVVACDLRRVEEARNGWPFLRDRRVDAYQGLTQRLLDE